MNGFCEPKFEITRPEIEALIQQRIRSSGHSGPKEVILEALRASEGPRRTGADLIAAIQSSPHRKTDLEVISKLEPDLFLAVTGLTVKDFHLLVRLRVFNAEQMNQAVFAFRRYEDASLRYTGIESHPGLAHYGLYDGVVAKE